VIAQVNLVDICKPKQWKTIASSKLKSEGFPVYGANGRIGYYSEYTHELPTVLVTCRGATCGTINICEPKSYVNGNAMALDDLDPSVDLKYLYYVLNHRGFNDVISGSAQPQITRTNLKNLKIPLPSLEEQKKIAAILDAADALRQKDAQLIAKYNALSQSLFLDMFGDPVTNPMGWDKFSLGKLGDISTGSTPPSSKENMFGGEIPFVTPSDLDTNNAYKRYVTNDGANNSRTVNKNALLVCCIGATIGKIRIAEGFCAFNQQINAIQWGESINPYYGLYSFYFLKYEVIGRAISTTLPILKQSEFSKMKCTVPPITLQNQFAERIQHIEAQKQQAQASLQKSEDLFNSLLQRAFKGELTA